MMIASLILLALFGLFGYITLRILNAAPPQHEKLFLLAECREALDALKALQEAVRKRHAHRAARTAKPKPMTHQKASLVDYDWSWLSEKLENEINRMSDEMDKK